MSLDKNSFDRPIHVFYPPADEDFVQWTKAFSQIDLHTEPIPGAYHWNVKPHAMLYLLEHGCKEVIWIDADIIVTGNIIPLFAGLDGATIAVTEEALWGAYDDTDALRARLWDFEVGRVMPFTLNSAVVRVTRSHLGLLKQWKELLGSQEYKKNQLLDWRDKPPHMMGDQDVLSALLTSRQYANVPIKILKRGDHIVQYLGLSGYTVVERIKNFFGRLPLFIHSQGSKPWEDGWHAKRPSCVWRLRFRNYIEAVYLDLSPYTLSAMPFADKLNDGGGWTRSHFVLSAILRAIGFWYPPLVGLPIALVIDLVSLARKGSLTRRNVE